MDMNIFEIIYTYRKIVLTGVKTTLTLSVIMLIGGLILGSITASMLSLKSTNRFAKVGKAIARVYVEIFRGCPLIIQLFFGYFGISYLGMNLDEYTACSVVLVLSVVLMG